MKKPIYHNRHRFLALDRNFGAKGRYTEDIEWIEKRDYNATSGEYIANGFARWIKSIGNVDRIRFDGEGDGQFSQVVCAELGISNTDIPAASEFNPILRKRIEDRGAIKKENIVCDALIPPDPGGTMVVIANQLLDAFPFSVMRRRTRGIILEELAVSEKNKSEYVYQRLVNASLHEDADLVADPRSGLFAYSPAKINYVNNILSRRGKTYLAVIDYGHGKTPEEYLNDTNGIAYSPTSLHWLLKMAKKHSGTIAYSDLLATWSHLREYDKLNNPTGWQNLTIIETNNEKGDINVCKT